VGVLRLHLERAGGEPEAADAHHQVRVGGEQLLSCGSAAVRGERGGGAGEAAAAANRQVEVGAEQVLRRCEARGASEGVGCVRH